MKKKNCYCFFLNSLHCNMYLSFCSFSYNGQCFSRLKLSADDMYVLEIMEQCVRGKKLLSALKKLLKMSVHFDIDRACN